MSQGEEKTESPTEQKLKEARAKGQVAKSVDAVTLAALFFALMLLAFLAPLMVKKIIVFYEGVHNNGYGRLKPDELSHVIKEALDLWFWLSLPILAVALMGAVIGNVSQFGFLLTSHPLKPDLKRLNPQSGVKKMFSKDRLVELVKQLAKLSAVSLVIFYSVKNLLAPITLLFRVPLAFSIAMMADFLSTITVRVLICFLLITILDILWQRYSFKKSMRMTKYEVKKEYIQQEGDPHIKQERRRFAEELKEAASQGNIGEAAVVITNPSHLAIAIKYSDGPGEVPTLLAKGAGRQAKNIISEATSLGLFVIRNVPLARDLQWLKIDEEIPEHLYDAVAEVLLFVNELNQKYGETTS